MNKAEILKSISLGTGVSRVDANKVLNAFVDIVNANDRVAWPGFGIFRHAIRAARKGRNPKTGESIDVPEKTVLVFKPSKS